MVTAITFHVDSSNSNGYEGIELIEFNWLITVSINLLNADDRFSRFSVYKNGFGRTFFTLTKRTVLYSQTHQ